MDTPIQKGFYRSRIYTSNVGINPLIVACDPILALMTNLKTVECPSDRDKFLEDFTHEIRAFEHRAQMANYQENIINAARYAICCLLNETISMASDWGKNNDWIQKNLLTVFNNGGEYFFTIIDRALKDTINNLHLLELLHLCLSFGFAGKYRGTEHGKKELEFITDNIYQVICQNRPYRDRSLFICDKKPIENNPEQNKVFAPNYSKNKTTKLLVITVISALFINCMIYLCIHLKLRSISKPIYQLIERSINIKDEN